jgi:3-hexulose-6-phosphate synthase
LIIEEGLAALEAVKAKYPDRRYLADLKVMDAGFIEAASAFRRGADIVTVLALADDATFEGALEASGRHGGQIMADLINVPDPAQRAQELQRLGVDIVCLHTAYDRQAPESDPMAELALVRSRVRCTLAIAGGINLQNAGRAVQSGAEIVVVGGGILSQASPGEAAAVIKAAMVEAR